MVSGITHGLTTLDTPDDSLAKMYLRAGREKARNGDIDAAIDEFENVLGLEGEHFDALYEIGSCLAKANQCRWALKPLRAALELRPDHTWSHAFLVYCLTMMGQYHEAVAAYEEALKCGAGGVNLHRNGGLACLEVGDYVTALVAYQHAADLDPNDKKAAYDVGYALSEAGRYREAIETFDRLVGTGYDPVTVYCAIAKAHSKIGDPRAEEAALRKAIEYDQLDLTPRSILCYSYMIRHDYVRAKATCIETLKLAPDDPTSLQYLGSICEKRKQYREARKAYQRLLDLDPCSVRALIRLSYICIRERRWEEAVDLSETAARIDPENADVGYCLGMAYYRSGRHFDATHELERSLRLRPDDPDSLGMLSMAYVCLGRYGEAASVSHQAVQLTPTGILRIRRCFGAWCFRIVARLKHGDNTPA